MKRNTKTPKGLLAAVIAVAAAMTVPAQAQVSPQTDTPKNAARHILVSIPERKLALLEDGKVVKVYAVAVGAAVSPSPVGKFTVINRLERPTYYHKGKVIPTGPQNPLGTRWMGLSEKGYGIHGTNVPSSIGKAASHGCIRMGRTDLEELFSLVHEGDTVEIVGERDEHTAAVFGIKTATLVAQNNTQEAPADSDGQ